MTKNPTESPARGKRPRRPKKNIVMFFLSLLIGAVGVFYSKQYIEEQVAYYKGQLEKTEPMVKVVVPNRKLVPGDIVSTELFGIREMPEKYADSNGVSGGAFDRALGQRVAFDVDEGRQLLWAHLAGGLEPTFSGKVPEGLRALTVRVDEINSISGFLQPRDSVDLFMSYGSGEEQEIFPLIERLEVIATGVQTLVDNNGDGSTRSFSTITVQVTPDDAQKITLAQEVGKVTAALRNPEDDSPLTDGPLNVADLLGIKEAPAAPVRKPVRAPEGPPPIEYIIGGS